MKHTPWKLSSHILCADCPLRQHTVCANCGPAELEKLDAIKTYITYQSGETIVRAGDKVEFLGSVMHGVATVSQNLIDGRRQIIRLLLPTDFLGFLKREVSLFDVVAISEVTICQLAKPQFEAMAQSSPALEHRLLETALEGLDAAREWMLVLGRKLAREKVARLLVILARYDAAQYGHNPADGLIFPVLLRRGSIADYLGLTSETVSRQFTALKNDGVIVFDDLDYVCVPYFSTLLEEARDDSDDGIIS